MSNHGNSSSSLNTYPRSTKVTQEFQRVFDHFKKPIPDLNATNDKHYLDLEEIKNKLHSFEYHGEFTIGWEDIEAKVGVNYAGQLGSMKITESEFERLFFRNPLASSTDEFQTITTPRSAREHDNIYGRAS